MSEQPSGTAMNRPLSKEERRRLMPVTTEIVDAYREVFGELASIQARENGIEIDWQKGSGR